MESAGKVHMTGLILRDFAPRNVLRLGDRYTLIDFHRVRGHDCSWDGDLRIGQPVPSTWDMQCKNIYNICFDMRIWECKSLLRAYCGLPVCDNALTCLLI